MGSTPTKSTPIIIEFGNETDWIRLELLNFTHAQAHSPELRDAIDTNIISSTMPVPIPTRLWARELVWLKDQLAELAKDLTQEQEAIFYVTADSLHLYFACSKSQLSCNALIQNSPVNSLRFRPSFVVAASQLNRYGTMLEQAIQQYPSALNIPPPAQPLNVIEHLIKVEPYYYLMNYQSGTSYTSPDGSHCIKLQQIGEIRFGPAYYDATLDNKPLGARNFGKLCL